MSTDGAPNPGALSGAGQAWASSWEKSLHRFLMGDALGYVFLKLRATVYLPSDH